MFEKCFAKGGFALVIGYVDLAVVQNPSARIGCDVGARAGQEDRTDGAMIFPIYLEWIFPCVAFQNVAGQILYARTCRAEANRNIKHFRRARLDVAACDHERIAGFSREFREIRQIAKKFQVVTAKVERAGSVIDPENRNDKPWIGN